MDNATFFTLQSYGLPGTRTITTSSDKVVSESVAKPCRTLTPVVCAVA
ncbi:MAG: hypothetical protein IJ775_03630 [Muribaculaceae bacterium]|nr:hypothetical protein [Muribaculaceae bacterium]